jgi:hypothetical protein
MEVNVCVLNEMISPAALAFSAPAGRASYAWRTLTSAARFLSSAVSDVCWVPVPVPGACACGQSHKISSDIDVGNRYGNFDMGDRT